VADEQTGVPAFSALAPPDTHNQRLEASVHPRDWTNPEGDGRYNLVVVGAGTAGLVAAAGAAGLGARVALVERSLMGGDCLNVGCVPSKALIRSARAAAEVRRAAEFGVDVPDGVRVDFGRVMERLRRLRADISPHDSADRFRSLGVDVFLGEGRFVGRRSLEVDGRRLGFARALVATGGRAAEPGVPGLGPGRYLTNETLFSLTELPATMAVLGAGPIGCEMAQAFARLGTRVVVIAISPTVLPREDPEATAFVESALRADGVNLVLGARVTAAEPAGALTRLHYLAAERRETVEVEAVLVAAGRRANVDGLGLEQAGVEFDPAGVLVDDFLRTTNPAIYAAGDVVPSYKFTHAADAMARIVLRNALFFGRARLSALTVPWCTYTSPELAHVGLTEADAARRSVAVDVSRLPLAEADRARLDGDDGLLKLLLHRGTDRIAGATLVAPDAGSILSELTLAMTAGLGLGRLAETIHPYPTQAEILKRAADAHNRRRLTPRVRRLFETLLAWRR
jgi:pyruvate/2-oxoglutarate dehydrogenase complex dihydrolipoamide dehydrogenase (E3) component